uniref:Uncharacterized protein n=1 Tax=Davidia involucrata TaxID=16924 RepID=A0A5B7AQ53_DAVIN
MDRRFHITPPSSGEEYSSGEESEFGPGSGDDEEFSQHSQEMPLSSDRTDSHIVFGKGTSSSPPSGDGMAPRAYRADILESLSLPPCDTRVVFGHSTEAEEMISAPSSIPGMVPASSDHRSVPPPSLQIDGAFGPFSSGIGVAARPALSQAAASGVSTPALNIPLGPPSPTHGVSVAVVSQQAITEVGSFHVHHKEAERVRRILSHYPDVGAGCPFARSTLRAMVFDSLLSAVRILEDKPISALTPEEIRGARCYVIDAKAGGLQVDWLLARIEELTEMMECS